MTGTWASAERASTQRRSSAISPSKCSSKQEGLKQIASSLKAKRQLSSHANRRATSGSRVEDSPNSHQERQVMTKAIRLGILRANAIFLLVAAASGFLTDVLGIFFS